MKTAAQMLLGQHVIAFNPLLADIAGDVKGGLFLSQLCYWSERTNNPQGWFYKTTSQWYEETRLTRRELETVRKTLSDMKVIDLALRGVPAKCHYRVNWERLEMLILSKNCTDSSLAENAKLDCTKTPNLLGGKRQTSSHKTAKQDCTKTPNKFVQKRQTITENTTEITPKNKTDISISAEKDSDTPKNRNAAEVVAEQAAIMGKSEAKALFSQLVAKATRVKAAQTNANPQNPSAG